MITLYLSLFLLSYSAPIFTHIFYIEGNTGSGKTTLLHALCERNPTFIGLEEPVSAVQNTDGINALGMMYEDQDRWSLTVNLLYCTCHLQRLKEIISHHPDSTIISDRSLYSGRAFCYADQLSGHLHPLESILYHRISEIAAASLPKPNGFIYIRTEPEVSYARIQKRHRKEESHVSFDYWKNLHEGHEHMLIKSATTVGAIPLLIIDYNDNMLDNPQAIKDAVTRIKAFIQMHAN